MSGEAGRIRTDVYRVAAGRMSALLPLRGEVRTRTAETGSRPDLPPGRPHCCLVPVEGFEPPCLAAPASEAGVYAFHHTGVEQVTGLEPASPRLKVSRFCPFKLHLCRGSDPRRSTRFFNLVEDRGNAPRRRSPCKSNPLTLEHPPGNGGSDLECPTPCTLVARLRLELSREVL